MKTLSKSLSSAPQTKTTTPARSLAWCWGCSSRKRHTSFCDPQTRTKEEEEEDARETRAHLRGSRRRAGWKRRCVPSRRRPRCASRATIVRGRVRVTTRYKRMEEEARRRRAKENIFVSLSGNVFFFLSVSVSVSLFVRSSAPRNTDR